VVFLAGAQTIAGAKIFGDITVSGSSNIKVASRSITRSIPLTWVNRSTKEAHCFHPRALAGETLTALLELPQGQVVTGVTLTINPDDVGSLPGAGDLPTITFYQQVLSTGVVTTIDGPEEDASADFTAYSAVHDIAITGLATALATTSTQYFLDFVNPSSDPVNIVGCRVTCTVTSKTNWS
jgi:hypothetical protein